MDSYRFELCVTSLSCCRRAETLGADRVELCSSLSEGGITPSAGLIESARKSLHRTKLHVLIRPRGGSFVYTAEEEETMIADIGIAKRLGVDGVVIGALRATGEIDSEITRRLADAAEGMSLTFHRAFDVSLDLSKSLEELIDLGFHRVLTSGGSPSVDQGRDMLKKLHLQAQGRIQILAGGGVCEQNIASLAAYTGIEEFHFSAGVNKCADPSFRVGEFGAFGFGSTTLRELSPERAHRLMSMEG